MTGLPRTRLSTGIRFAAWYSLVVGAMMPAQWTVFILAGDVPELETEPVRLAFHLAAEATTALALIVGGVLLLGRRGGAAEVALVAHGLLLYTVIVSPGYFAQNGEWPFVAMFAVILVLSLASIVQLMRAEGIRPQMPSTDDRA